MRFALVAAAFVALITFTVCMGMGENYLYVNDVNMRLNSEGNAVFEMNYTLETFTRFYVLALGCRYIEPDLVSMFGDFDNVTTVRADPDSAALLAKGAGKYNSGYYLYESRRLGARIARLTVIYPEGRPKTFYNITATPNVFCIARAPPNLAATANNLQATASDLS